MKVLFLTRLAWVSGVDVVELVLGSPNFGEQRFRSPTWQLAVRRKMPRRRNADCAHVLYTMVKMMLSETCDQITAEDLQAATGVSPKHPSWRFPLVRRLMGAHRDARRITRLRAEVWRVSNEIRRSIRAVEDAGGTVCVATVGRGLESPGLLRSAGVRRIRDGFLRAVNNGNRTVLDERQPPPDVVALGN